MAYLLWPACYAPLAVACLLRPVCCGPLAVACLLWPACSSPLAGVRLLLSDSCILPAPMPHIASPGLWCSSCQLPPIARSNRLPPALCRIDHSLALRLHPISFDHGLVLLAPGSLCHKGPSLSHTCRRSHHLTDGPLPRNLLVS